jgi:hypothetical protein
MAGLPARERRILTMRFYDEMTQASIATELGLSQMHISRRLRQTLTRLRLDLIGTEAELVFSTAVRPGPVRARRLPARRSASVVHASDAGGRSGHPTGRGVG